MQLIKPGINIDFVGKKNIAFIFSALLILISIGSLVIHNGPRYGIDFAGGTVIQLKFHDKVEISKIRSAMKDLKMVAQSIQTYGEDANNEYLVRTDRSVETGGDFHKELTGALRTETGSEPEIRRIEMVGPQVGKDLREKALFAMFYALLFITIYISGRFESQWVKSGAMALILILIVVALAKFSVSIPWLIAVALVVTLIVFWVINLRYAMGAIVALIHDVMITVGIFSIAEKEFSLPIIAALLTIIGYSLNDTIIVFDRIRENIKKYQKNHLSVNINKSINETLSRTLLTSLTTIVVIIALFVFGGGIIHDFAFALLIGVLIGTYSSVFVASPILLAWSEFGKR